MVIQWLKLPHCTSMSSTSQLGCFFSLSDRDIQSVQILVEYTMPSRYTLMQSIYLRSGSSHTYCVRVCQSDLFYAYIDIYWCVCETNPDMLSIQIHIWHLGKILATHIKYIMICIYIYTYLCYILYILYNVWICLKKLGIPDTQWLIIFLICDGRFGGYHIFRHTRTHNVWHIFDIYIYSLIRFAYSMIYIYTLEYGYVYNSVLS